MTGEIHLTIEGMVARIKLDHAKKLNVLTWEMLKQLDQHISTIEQDDRVRAAILEAVPARAFCAGAAIDQWAEFEPQQFSKIWVREGHRIFNRLAHLSVPTLGIIEAPAYGGGLELIATLDWRILGPDSMLSLPETSIGIIPGWSGTQRLARLIPEPLLRAMTLMGKSLTAEAAAALGFCEVAENPQTKAEEMVTSILARGPEANRLAKMMINAGVGEERATMIEALAGGMAAASHDKATGVAAFKAKLPPKF